MSPGNGREGARREDRGRGGLAAALGLMRKAGVKEGSIGSKGAIDVNQSPVSVAVTGRQSDLMIKVCSCTARSSSSSLCNLSNKGVLMTCKGCSGESTSTTDKTGPACSNKLNRMVLELPRPINLDVRWKNVKRRQRAARRARTSFFGEDRMKDELRSFYAFGNAANREMSQEDARASDSEKLGVSILGGRFSDPMGNVPIKKRRFRMDCSPSPPPTPLLVDPYEKILRSCSGGIPSYEKRRKVKMLEDEWKEEHRGGLFDADDFSGISILAAAACESVMDDDMLNGTCSKLPDPLDERKLGNTCSTELSLLHGMKGEKSNDLEVSNDTYNRSFEPSYSAPDMKPLIATTHSSKNLDELVSGPKVNCSLHSALNADKTDIASDDKSSSVAMVCDSSNNPDKSAGCSQDASAQNKCANAARDSRLHWDLNVAMEAWDTDCGNDDDHGGPTVATVNDRGDAENDMNKPQLHHDHDSIHAGNAHDLCLDQIHMVGGTNDVNTIDEGDFPADSSSNPLHHQPSQNLEILKSESVGKDTSAETLDLPEQQKSRFASAMESHLGSNPDPVLVSEHFPLTANVEKNDGSHPTPVGKGLSHMSCVDVGDNSVQKSELGSTVKPLASRLVSEESTNFPTVTAFRKITTDVGWSENKLEEASEQSISEWKNQELLDDSGTSKLHQLVSKKDEHCTDVLKSPVDTENLTHAEDIPRSSICDMANAHEENGADAMTNSKDCLITCASSSSAETYYISGVVQAPALSSECNKPVVTDAGSIVDSQAAAHSYQNMHENGRGRIASDICLEQCYETDASHYSKGVAGIGKMEEDDSQYEDGEVRESGDWADDTYEVKCGNWHYPTSDYNNEAIISDLHPLPSHSASKTLCIPVSGYNGTHTRKEDDTFSPVLSRRSWSTNCLDGGSGCGKAQGIHLRVAGETQVHEINPGLVAVGSAVTVGQSERCNDGLGDDLSSIRTKNTGWDMFPEDQRHSRRDSRDQDDSSNRCVLSSIDAGGADDLFRKMGLSNRDVKQIERPRSFDSPHRNEMSRSDDGYASGSKAERAIDSHRSSGVYDVSRHIQAGRRGEQWVENSKHPRPTWHKSPERCNYGPTGPRNAAEAAVAKMESNGFVVAPDGCPEVLQMLEKHLQNVTLLQIVTDLIDMVLR
ncbi:hypothetical protein QOZ80_8AG0631560 [Eleusine coracana subsp. coracana]|nr:hypothetical protein QOZ80_8AG0631560 [Eleusine coracana subsp. coracana]